MTLLLPVENRTLPVWRLKRRLNSRQERTLRESIVSQLQAQCNKFNGASRVESSNPVLYLRKPGRRPKQNQYQVSIDCRSKPVCAVTCTQSSVDPGRWRKKEHSKQGISLLPKCKLPSPDWRSLRPEQQAWVHLAHRRARQARPAFRTASEQVQLVWSGCPQGSILQAEVVRQLAQEGTFDRGEHWTAFSDAYTQRQKRLELLLWRWSRAWGQYRCWWTLRSRVCVR